MPRRLHDEAVVVERRVLGEADLVLVLLCRVLGKVSAVAPAGRSSRRRFAGCLDLFGRIEVELVDTGRSGLCRLAEAALVDAHAGIRKDLVAIAHAGYLAELTAAMLKEGEEAGSHFELLSAALGRLDQGPFSSADLRRFELELLARCGLAPQLDRCLICAGEPTGSGVFDFDQGGLICDRCGPGPQSEPLSVGVDELLRQLQSGRVPMDVPLGAMSAARRILARVIDRHTGRVLKARRFLKQMASE